MTPDISGIISSDVNSDDVFAAAKLRDALKENSFEGAQRKGQIEGSFGNGGKQASVISFNEI